MNCRSWADSLIASPFSSIANAHLQEERWPPSVVHSWLTVRPSSFRRTLQISVQLTIICLIMRSNQPLEHQRRSSRLSNHWQREVTDGPKQSRGERQSL